MQSVTLCIMPVSYTHLRAHETSQDLVCRLRRDKGGGGGPGGQRINPPMVKTSRLI
ncbi:hypothetical protein ACX3V1_27550 [Escherichia coli]